MWFYLVRERAGRITCGVIFKICQICTVTLAHNTASALLSDLTGSLTRMAATSRRIVNQEGHRGLNRKHPPHAANTLPFDYVA